MRTHHPHPAGVWLATLSTMAGLLYLIAAGPH